MRTHLVAAVGLTLSLAVVAALGCGADPDPRGADEETAVQSDAISGVLSPIELPRYFTLRKDRRGGWLVAEANVDAEPIRVTHLDFSRDVGPGEERDVVGAPAESIVLRGVLGERDGDGERAFLVDEAFRGMPGFDPAQGDGYYTVSCADPICQTATARLVDTTTDAEIHGISVDAALAPGVSGAWLVDRVENHGAVVAGHLTPTVPWAITVPRRMLVASQVFVDLAEESGPCMMLLHVCPAPLRATYTRDANLCLDFDACVSPGVCPEYIPACAEGYTLVSWAAGDHACPAFACNPAFLTE